MIDRDALVSFLASVARNLGADPDHVEEIANGVLALEQEPARRHWEGEALAAFDQALANAPEDAAFAAPDFWLQRAQAAANIASAEQARIGNLIAWKQLQATRQATRDFGADLMPLASGDAVADQIEEALGL